MDLAEFLRNSGGSSSSTGSIGDVGGSNDEAALEGRGMHFNQKRTNPHGTMAESRALRASQTEDRRKSKRGQQIDKKRAIIQDTLPEEVQDENRDVANIPLAEKQKSRREKLEEFRKKKQQQADMKKKAAKPAFKSGLVHHPIAPFGAGAHKPLVHGNRTVNRTTTRGAGNTSVKSNFSTLSVASSRSTGQKQTASSRNVLKPKRMVRREKPVVTVKPPSTSGGSSSSAGSTGSVSTFAPENFQFKPLDVPNISTPIELTSQKFDFSALSKLPLNMHSENDESSADEVFVSEPRGTRKSARKSGSVGTPKADSKQTDLNDTEEEPINQNEEEKMIANQNEEEEMTTNQGDTDEVTTNQDGESSANENNGVVSTEEQENVVQQDLLTPDRGRSRTSRRSRRISGIQPDPSIPDTELAKTPARRVKERSLSSTRRASALLSSCVCCDSPNHDEHATAGRTPAAASSPARRTTPMKTPRTASRVSRKSVLPVVSESSPSNDEAPAQEETAEVPSARRKSRRLSKLEHMEVEESSSQDELEPEKDAMKRRRSTRRASSRALPLVKDNEQEDQNSPAQTKTMPAAAVNTPVHPRNVPLPLETPSEKLSTPEQAAPMEIVFKTPLPATAGKRKVASAAKLRQGATPTSPWIEDRQRRSIKRKYSLSETKPSKSSISDLFEDIPTSESPLSDVLAKKFRSSDNINESEVEDILQQFKAQRLFQDAEKDADEEEITGASQKAGDNKDSTVKPALEATTDDTAVEVVAQAKAVEGQEESEHDVPYFRNLLVSETDRITRVCNDWESKISSEIPEDMQGQIRTVVGQGRLVMAERFKQFSGLVDNCEFGTGEKTTSCMDLQGFWEMIYFQVEDVDRKLNELTVIEQNDWKEIQIVPAKQAAKKKTVLLKKPVVKKSAVSGLRAHILAQKKKKAEGDDTQPKKPSIKDMIAAKRAALANQNKEEEVSSRPTPRILVENAEDQEDQQEAEKSFDGGFFSIKSPVSKASPTGTSLAGTVPTGSSLADKSPRSPSSSYSPRATKSTGGDRLRRAVLTDSARRISGMVSPYVSQMARRSLNKEADNDGSPEDKEESASRPTARRSELFQDMEDDEKDTDKDIASERMETEAVYATTDPIVPLCSPVTKTYGGSPEHSKHEQAMDAAFDMLVSTPAERVLDDTETTTPSSKSKSALRSSKRKGSQSVKFTEETENRTGSASVTSTPHPRTRRSTRAESKKNDSVTETQATNENIDPNLLNPVQPSPASLASPSLRKASRVSLLPGLETRDQVAVVSPSQDLMCFSPLPTSPRPTRRSSVKKQ